MKKLSVRLWAKCLAFILFCVFAASAVLCAGGYVYALTDGWYKGVAVPFEDTALCRDYVSSQASTLAWAVREGETLPELDGVSYRITNARGRVVADTTKAGSVPVDAVWQVDDDVLTLYIDLPVAPGSDAYPVLRLYNVMHSLAGWFLPLGIAFTLAGIALFIFLLAAAGKREDGAIALGGFDRLPLDVVLLIVALFAMVGINAGVDVSYSSRAPGAFIGLAALGLLAVAAVGLGLCVTLSARFKAGKWWHNTLIYIVGRFLCRCVAGFFRALPLTWKALLVYCAFTLLNVVLTAAAVSGRNGWLLAAFVMDVAGLWAVIRVSAQLRALKAAGLALAAGDMTVTVDTAKMWPELREHGEALGSAAQGMARAVSQRMKSERMKTELITNVSHDLKTPLTSIVSYVDLLKKEDIPGETARGYIEVLDRQSQRLKKLTEDLVEASKASSGVVTVRPERLDLAELLRQSAGEYAERFAAAGVEPVVTAPAGELSVWADGRLLARVLDNLLLNVTKYSLPGTRAYLELARQEGQVLLTLKNISREPLNIPAEELLERFVRGDASRGSDGSGLGLSIAQSLTELMGGTLTLQLDGDLFKVTLAFPDRPAPALLAAE